MNEYFDFFKDVIESSTYYSKLSLQPKNYKLVVDYVFNCKDDILQLEHLFYKLIRCIDIEWSAENEKYKYKVIIEKINNCDETIRKIFFSTIFAANDEKPFIEALFTNKSFFTKESWEDFIKYLHDRDFMFYNNKLDIDLIIELKNLGFDVASRVERINTFYPEVNILYKEGLLTKEQIIKRLKDKNHYRWNTTKEEKENLINLGVFTSKEYMELKKEIISN